MTPPDLIHLFDLRHRLLVVADLEWEEREIGHNEFLEVDRCAEAEDAAREGVAAYLDHLADQGEDGILEEVFAVTPLTEGRFAICTDACPSFTLADAREAEQQPTPEQAATALYERALYGLRAASSLPSSALAA